MSVRTKSRRWVKVTPIENPCKVCHGSGSKWKKRKDGNPDLRFVHPIGPCDHCGGSGEEPA